MKPFTIRRLESGDRTWVSPFVGSRWGAEIVVVHGTVYQPADLPGFVAMQGGAPIGLITYTTAGRACEIVTLDSTVPSIGVGTALLEAVRRTASEEGCRRLWLITTNDNTRAMQFYQKRGFALVAIHRDAVNRARALKPDIPLTGNDGIPLRDEVEMEAMLE